MVLVDLVVVLKKKMGCRHSKPEGRVDVPPPPPYPHPPPHLHPCYCPCPYPPQPPNSHWGPKSASRPVSIPSSMPSLETASLPSEDAPAPAKIGISKSSESIQLEGVRMKFRRTHIKTASRSIRHIHCKIKMLSPRHGKEGSA